MTGEGRDTPQAAALASWAAVRGAEPSVVEVTVRGDRAEVVLEVAPGYRYWVYCHRHEGDWHEGSSGNGPTVGWDDPEQIPGPAVSTERARPADPPGPARVREHLVVDAMNVLGSRPDGWWRDRDAALRRLFDRLQHLAQQDDLTITLVCDGREVDGAEAGEHGDVRVLYASRRGPDAADDRLVELLDEGAIDLATTTVITADRHLRERCEDRGVEVAGPRGLLARLDDVDPTDGTGPD